MVLSVAFRMVFLGSGFSACFYLFLRHILLLACITQHLTVDKDQDTVFDGSVHGFTFDVKRLELRHINMAQMEDL